MTLDEIGQSTNTDKQASAHDYLHTYEQAFAPLRGEPVRLLEMGVLGGDSILMWSKFFTHPSAYIVGIDIEPHRCQNIRDPRVEVLAGSQTDANVFWGAPFDIIIDDAGHFASQQQAAFDIYWSRWLKPGGFYCIEDLHTYASPAHCDAPKNVMQWLNEICTEIQGRGPDAKGKVKTSDKWAFIDTITFRKGLAIIRKAV